MTREPRRLTRRAHVEGGLKDGSLKGVQAESSTWAQRLQQAASQRLEPRVLCQLGLAILGHVGYDGKPGRAWIVWSGWVPGGVDDGGPGKLTLSAALADYAGRQ